MDWQKCFDGNSAQLKMSDQQGNFHFSLFWANYNPQKAIHSKDSRTKMTNTAVLAQIQQIWHN